MNGARHMGFVAWVALTAGTLAHAQEAATTESVHVRASHRVDVIAPGEKVESVIDRMRSESNQTTATHERQELQQLPVRSPEHKLDRPGPENVPRPNGVGPGSGGAPAPTRGDTPPPDRPSPRR